MLNTLPPSPVIRPPLPPRRRGGQPSNNNALKPGLIARRNPNLITHLANSIQISKPGLEGLPEVISHAIPALREQIALLSQTTKKAAGLRSSLPHHRAIIRLTGLLMRLRKALARHRQPLLHLQFVARHALDLLRYDLRQNGITRDAYSFRGKSEKSDLNSQAFQENFFSSISDPPASFLTPHQWKILEPLIPPSDNFLPSPNPHVSPYGKDLGRRRGRGRPPVDPRPLLEAIFWKFAHHARWCDLPPGSPPMLTCRRYYRRLFLSGRLFTIYSTLYADLSTCGQADLTDLVQQGCFTIAGNKLILSPGQAETWQVRTAMLIMQLGWQVSRRILRQKEQQERRHFPFSTI